MSPSSRRAWIEISIAGWRSFPGAVALLAEGVDRNTYTDPASGEADRVALLAEGVDRNTLSAARASVTAVSPSSRRAWIEIAYGGWRTLSRTVALLAEGVDRNFMVVFSVMVVSGRPPRGGRG